MLSEAAVTQARAQGWENAALTPTFPATQRSEVTLWLFPIAGCSAQSVYFTSNPEKWLTDEAAVRWGTTIKRKLSWPKENCLDLITFKEGKGKRLLIPFRFSSLAYWRKKTNKTLWNRFIWMKFSQENKEGNPIPRTAKLTTPFLGVFNNDLRGKHSSPGKCYLNLPVIGVSFEIRLEIRRWGVGAW